MAKKSEIEIAAAAEVPAVVEKKNYFEELYSVNVSEKTEKKNGLTYLSWAWAWAELKKRHPEANYSVLTREDGRIYWDDGRTAWVAVAVDVPVREGVTLRHTEYLPIMDTKNKSIKAELVTSCDANKAIQRALTKAIARHGLGLYVYAGEDLPEGLSDEEAKGIMDACASIPQLNEAFRSLSEYGFAREKLIAWGEERKRALAHAGKEAA